MSNIVEYTLMLNDKISAKMRTIGIANDQQLSTWSNVQKKVNAANVTMNNMGRSIGSLKQRIDALRSEKEWIPASNKNAIKANTIEIEKLERELMKLDNLGKKKNPLASMFGSAGSMLTSMGIGFGLYQVGDMVRKGVEKAHILHLAQAQVRASIQSTKGVAGISFDDTKNDAKKFSSTSLYGRGEITDMQSMLLTFPSVSKRIFSSAQQSILDMSTKMHQDVKMSTIMVGKALQDPAYGVMALRRVGVNLTREQAKIIKGLVASGHKDIAQAMILKELNTEFGGSAKAAYDATPLARFHKMIGAIELKLGEMAITIQEVLAPVLEGMAGLYHKIIQGAKWFYNLLKDGNPYAIAFITILGSITGAMLLYYTWVGIVSLATKIWAGIQAVFNLTLWANPITWIIAGIIALIAIIYIVSQMTTGWGKTWDNTVKWMKLGIQLFAESIKLTWLVIKDQFASGFETIEKGWYKLQSLWDKDSANAGLAKLSNQRNDRAKEIAEARGKVEKLATQMASMKVWELKGNGKTFKSMFSGLKHKLGLDNAVPGEGDTGGGATGGKSAESIATGGTRNTSINIHLGKMVENIVFQGGLKENAKDMERQVEELLMRVLFAAESAS